MNTFTYDQQSGESAGAAAYISETGKYTGKLLQAEYVISSNKGTKGIEFSFEAANGEKGNYLTAWYEKSDGSQIKMGIDMINAIMGCTKTQSLSMVSVAGQNGAINVAPELKDKPLGLVLQKTLKTKQDGTDTYSFDIRIPFIAQTGKTLKEQMSGKDAQLVDRMVSTLKDKDERTGRGQHQAQGGYHQPTQEEMPEDFDNWG
jgi:hypothetical protein